MRAEAREALAGGVVIPACPLALNHERKLDERRQRALARYYCAAGAGGIAVGVHTTQFAIRDPQVGLFEPVLRVMAEEMRKAEDRLGHTIIRIGGICGELKQAAREADLLREIGYDAGLLSLGALRDASDDQLIEHCQRVAERIPIVGFYLQPLAGGRVLPYSFWRRFAELEKVAAIKIAPFNRYQTIDVVRAIAEAGREDIALYTGNDDNIIADLVTPFRFEVNGVSTERRIVGGLLGQWAVWTRAAVNILDDCHALARKEAANYAEMLRRNVELTDANAVIFDAVNEFAGCIPGIHEVLRRQGLLEGTWCLHAGEVLSPGQSAELDRICAAYPHLADDDFVAAHVDEWLQ